MSKIDALSNKDNLIVFVTRTDTIPFGKPFHTCAHCGFILEGFNVPANYIGSKPNYVDAQNKKYTYEEVISEYKNTYDDDLKNITGSILNLYDNVIYRDYIYGIAG